MKVRVSFCAGSSEKFVEYEFAGAEVRAPEAIQRRTKVRKAVFRRVSQHAQGAQDDEAMVASLEPGNTVFNEEFVGGQFQCQGQWRQPRPVRDRSAAEQRAPPVPGRSAIPGGFESR